MMLSRKLCVHLSSGRRMERFQQYNKLSASTIVLISILFLFANTIKLSLETSNVAQQEDDEEILILPPPPTHDNHFEKISSLTHYDTAKQTTFNQENDQENQSLKARLLDPFKETFDDYLKETSTSKTWPHHVNDENENEKAKESSSSLTPLAEAIPLTSGNQAASFIIEEEENSIMPKEKEEKHILNFDHNKSSSTDQQQEAVNDNHQKHHPHHHHHHKVDEKRGEKRIEDESVDRGLLEEITLLFAWKKIPTNKCSKECGKGFRLNHISCVDLKYDVRVEDELCLKANLKRPSETNEESCNEIDCSPQWTSLDLQQCNSSKTCKNYKRVQCTMMNKSGHMINLDDSKCNSTEYSHLNESHNSTTTEHNQALENSIPRPPEDYIVDVSRFNESVENNDWNNIIFHFNEATHLKDELNERESSQQLNEPFYEIGEWSECSGASCGKLGTRFRNISCRLYLAKSEKFVELPESSCHHTPAPDTHEPCYMDCLYSQETDFNRTINLSDEQHLDETFYDLEMTRYVWRTGGWTKCSAECLSGQRESIIECLDKLTESPVDSSLCDQELKPPVVIESCNNNPCQPEWKVQRFSECSRSCGSAGVNTRSVACVQQVATQTGYNHMVVADDLCIQSDGPMPLKSKPCNRVDCRPEWNVGPWSECSSKCGVGVKSRKVICVQEFASREGPERSSESLNPDLQEALEISKENWHSGKVTQIPFQECYQEYKTIPTLEKRCFNYCEKHHNHAADSEPAHSNHITFRRRGSMRSRKRLLM